MFVMMSGKSKRDYKKVMPAVLYLLPEQPAVECLAIDCEAARLGKFHENVHI